MVKKTGSVVIFSLFYPYSTFDYYVDPEIEMIGQQFNKLYIIPINKEGNIERKLPANAQLIDSPFVSTPAKALLKALFSVVFYKELFLAIRKGKLNKNVLKHLILQHAKVIFFRKELAQLLKSDPNVTLVYSHWLLEGVYAAALLKSKYSFKLISKAHSLDIYKERHINQYIPFLENTILQTDQVHFISDQGRQYFLKNYAYNINPDRLHVSRLGIRNLASIKQNKTDDTLKLISVSYIYPLKRVDLILEGIALLNNIKIEWHHIGAYYPDHTEKLKQKAKELLKNKPHITVKWLGNFSVPQVYDYYQNNDFDLFVSASSSEGIPLSMMECMSFGIPVLSTNVGGVSEIVTHGVNGVLMDANPSAADIARELLTFYEMSKNKRETMRNQAHLKWKTCYNADTNFKRFLEIAVSNH